MSFKALDELELALLTVDEARAYARTAHAEWVRLHGLYDWSIPGRTEDLAWVLHVSAAHDVAMRYCVHARKHQKCIYCGDEY